ncbi:MAG TPA: non-homologous end-joining DNA ligase [Chthoniobacterales bacterium]|nr:non-homologous end-joining DNA ligase [Chthoniobacterales bacterium]
MGLKKYQQKRDFSKTAEPSGGKPLPKQVRGACRFVIQKHDASRLHYDFRLQMEGVLKSWALPKGLPWAKGEKHLAVEVEDHPIDYEDFEGIIPQGQYGGGTVMVWDQGVYYVFGEQPVKSLRDGRLHLVLAGEKAQGEWTLVRMRGRDGEKNTWLIIKTGNAVKPPSKKTEDQSVKTGRTMAQIANQRDAEWQSNRQVAAADSAASANSKFKARIQAALKKKAQGVNKNGGGRAVAPQKSASPDANVDLALKKLPSARPRFIEPMKARLEENPPAHGDWLYELKFDGIRAITIKDGKRVSLISRNGNKLDKRFPEIADAVKELPVYECVLDGEAVALDQEGRSSFQLLQALEMEGRKAPLRFYVFDLLQLNGESLLDLPVEQRKQVLASVCEKVGDPIRYSGEITGDVKSLLAEVKRRGLEGLIGKQRGSKYEPGRRSGAWIKLKSLNEQEFVIGGYTPPAGSRKYFGAVLVGYCESGKLKFAGKVGTGFTEKSLSMLYKKFRAEERDDCPFVDLPSKQGGAWVQGITPSMMHKMHWVNPKFVAQVKFLEWTRDLKLRAPVFLGLRDDKDPRKVVRER